MIKNMRGLIAQGGLGFIIACGLLLGIGFIQIAVLVQQFNPYLPKTEVLITSYFSYAYVVMLCIGLTALIWIEIRNLEEFHIDKFTIITFILGSLLRPRVGIAGEAYFSGLVRLSGILIVIVLIVKKPKTLRTNLRWSLTGIIAGSISVILIAILELYLRPTWLPSPLLQNSTAPTVLGMIFKQFSMGVPLEEIWFRGFLWGYLRRYGWEENKIIWTQGLLFWLIHFSRIFAEPFTFFLVIPLFTLILSKLRSYSKQIYPSILSHTIMNTVGALLNLATF